MLQTCVSIGCRQGPAVASRLVALLAGTPPQQQHQHQQWQHLPCRCRSVWNDSIDQREARKADSFYDSTIERYAEQPIETLSLEQMLTIGRNVLSDPSKIIQSARFVQEELPKRLARRLLDLQLLPHLVVTNPHIQRVYMGYFHAFETLRAARPVTSLADNTEFCGLLRRLVDEHAPLLDELAAGLVECRAKRLVGPALQLDHFLDAMLRSRISRRVMAEQHLHIANARPGYIGSIATALDVPDAVQFAGQRAVQVCSETYGLAPEVVVSGDMSARLPYLTSHLDYMVYELLKNSMRAVVERHRKAKYTTRSKTLPPIVARVCSGGSHLTIRISDQGGGIPQQHLNHVWSYGFTTSPTGQPELDSQLAGSSNGSSGSSSWHQSGPQQVLVPGVPATDPSAQGLPTPSSDSSSGAASGNSSSGSSGDSAAFDQGAAADAHLVQTAAAFGNLLSSVSVASQQRYSLAGLGFGLPMSRLYARYFGGDLCLVNLPGYGVDAFLTLRRLDTGGWREQLDADEAAAGSQVAVEAALTMQQQLQRKRVAN